MLRRVLLVLLVVAFPTISSGQGGTQGFWTPISSMPSPAGSHTLTPLADGKILVAGGLGAATGSPGMMTLPPSAAAVLYRPEFNDWLPVSPMAGVRYLHGAAAILGGTAVLVAGGSTTPVSLTPPLRASLGGDLFGSCGTAPTAIGMTAAEIFHENTLGWTPAAPMNVARAQFTMVRLFNGQVLAAGGGSAEIYNPATDTWTPTSGMQATRFGEASTLLPDGRVFLAGGDSGGGFVGNFCPADAEVYDPSVDTWFNAGGMTVNHWHGTATLYHLPDGSPRVLVAGGYDGNSPNGAIATVESWNPATNTFIQLPDMLIPRVLHDATLRTDGKILVTGGINELGDIETRSEVYDPVTNSWSIAAPMIFPHAGHTVLNLTDPLNGQFTGKILVAGGLSGGGLTTATAEIFQQTPLASITSIGTQNLGNSGTVSACQPDVITATVGSGTGLGTPTGSVSFLGNFGGVLVGLGPTLSNNGVYSLDALLPAGNYQILARYAGDSNFLPSDSRTLAVQSVAPPIAVSGPKTAALGSQITLTASVPAGAVSPFSFMWTLPDGSNFSGDPLMTAPSMLGPNVYTVNGTDSNGCALSPAGFAVNVLSPGVNLLIQLTSLFRDGAGNIHATLKITQLNADTLSDLQVTGSTLGTSATTVPLPSDLGPLAGGGASTFVTLAYPGNAAAAGTQVRLAVSLTYTDSVTGGSGNANASLRVTAP